MMKQLYQDIILEIYRAESNKTFSGIAKAVDITEDELIKIIFEPSFQQSFRTGINYLMFFDLAPIAIRQIRAKLKKPFSKDGHTDVSVAIKFMKDAKYFEYSDLDSKDAENAIMAMIENDAVCLDPSLITDDDLREAMPDERILQILKPKKVKKKAAN